MLLRWALLACVPLLMAACGGSVESGAVPSVSEVSASGDIPSYFPLPLTATPYPTFTPVPTLTPEPTPVPTATLAPTPTLPLPRVELVDTVVDVAGGDTAVVLLGENISAGPAPVVEAAPVIEATPEVTAVPTPTPYGKVWSSDVYFYDQSLFPLQRGELPPTLVDVDLFREPDRIPRGREQFPVYTPYIVWLVVMDTRGAAEDFVMDGMVRWIDRTFDGYHVLMHTSPVHLTVTDNVFFKGLGTDSGSLWSRPGSYRIELLDDRGDLLLYWNFEVK